MLFLLSYVKNYKLNYIKLTIESININKFKKQINYTSFIW